MTVCAHQGGSGAGHEATHLQWTRSCRQRERQRALRLEWQFHHAAEAHIVRIEFEPRHANHFVVCEEGIIFVEHLNQ